MDRGDALTGSTGVNRLTQDLVDNGTYISGSPTAQLVSPGAAYVTPANINAVGGITNYYAAINAYSALNPATIKSVALDRRTLIGRVGLDRQAQQIHDVLADTGYGRH